MKSKKAYLLTDSQVRVLRVAAIDFARGNFLTAAKENTLNGALSALAQPLPGVVTRAEHERCRLYPLDVERGQ